MANTIQIKRSLLSAAPSSLAEGEPAYVFGTDTLYIGAPGNTMIIIAGASTYAKLASPTFTGLVTTPLIKITGGAPGAGKVLTSDADGDATWETPTPGVTDHTLLSNIGTNTHAQIDTHLASTSNPHSVTKAQVGLANADNTSDVNKPVSTAQAAADAATLASAQSYSDGLVIGLLDDRGNYDASVNTFPASGGSGTAGAVKKGDLWTISVAGTLGGTSVAIGDLVRALVDTPGQTAGNWALTEANIGYVAENAANKVTSISGASTDVQYGSAKLLYDQLLLKLTASLNLSDLANAGTARTNLGLGTMATQNANAVAITGGTINGITIDGGSF